MHRFVALFLIVLLAGAPDAFAQSVTVGDYLYVDNWRLPKSHKYQALINGNHVDVNVGDVHSHLVVKTPVLDKTTFEWVYHPDSGPNPKYQYTGKMPTATKPAPTKPKPAPTATAPKPAPKPVTGGIEPKPAPKPAPTTKPAPAPVATVVTDGPDDKDDCKNDGWKRFTNPSFENQGDCVSWTNHHGGKGKGKGK